MKTYLARLALVLLLLGGLACSSEERSSQEPPDPRDSEKTANPEKANGGSKEPSAAPAPEERDADRDDAPEDAGTDVSALLAEDAELNQPAAGYAIVTDGVGALSLEVPSGWEHATGEASEIGTANWSNFAGEGLASSITASPDIETWNEVGGLAGTYAVASTALAQAYTDDELVSSGPNDLSASCEPGAISGYERGPYSGRVQAWKNCGGDPAASYVTLSAAPEGRECVVLLHVAMFGDADVQVGQHILDTFEADCGATASYPLASADEQYAKDSEPNPQYTPEDVPLTDQDISDESNLEEQCAALGKVRAGRGCAPPPQYGTEVPLNTIPGSDRAGDLSRRSDQPRLRPRSRLLDSGGHEREPVRVLHPQPGDGGFGVHCGHHPGRGEPELEDARAGVPIAGVPCERIRLELRRWLTYADHDDRATSHRRPFAGATRRRAPSGSGVDSASPLTV